MSYRNAERPPVEQFGHELGIGFPHESQTRIGGGAEIGILVVAYAGGQFPFRIDSPGVLDEDIPFLSGDFRDEYGEGVGYIHHFGRRDFSTGKRIGTEIFNLGRVIQIVIGITRSHPD